MAGFCEPEDVRLALQDRNLDGPTEATFAEPAIEKVSDWLARSGNHYFYDSTAADAALIPTSATTAANVRLDIPSSPHAQRDQLFSSRDGARYPVTSHGPYAKVPLPHGYVQSLTKLDVRDLGGGVEDWVATSDKTEGRGEDYYIQREGQHSYGRTVLFVRARSVGSRRDFGGILTAEYEYGLDAQDASWGDVRRGVAQLAAAELVIEDDVVTAIPDSGQLVGVDTQRQQLADDGMSAIEPYLTVPGGT